MSLLAERVAEVGKQYLGPAAGAFLVRELKALDLTAEQLRESHLPALAEHARRSATRLMDEERAIEMAKAFLKVRPEKEKRRAPPPPVADERIVRVRFLERAVQLAPTDLAAHRRYAATVANLGDFGAACAEYGRFIDACLAAGDVRRAWLELTYGRETLGDRPDLLAIVDRVAAASAPAPAPARPPEADARPEPPTTAQPVRAPARPAAPPSNGHVGNGHVANGHVGNGHVGNGHVGNGHVANGHVGNGHVGSGHVANGHVGNGHVDNGRPGNGHVGNGHVGNGHVGNGHVASGRQSTPRRVIPPQPIDGPALLAEARLLIQQRKLIAASDLLLWICGRGETAHEAQRLLIEVDCGLGRRDVARDKCRLLGSVYRLVGQPDVASDVERLAAII